MRPGKNTCITIYRHSEPWLNDYPNLSEREKKVSGKHNMKHRTRKSIKGNQGLELQEII